MNIGDFKNKCRTWVLGIPGELRYLKYNASHARWEWTKKVIKATSYPSAEAASKAMQDNPRLLDLIADDPSRYLVSVVRVGLYVMQEDM